MLEELITKNSPIFGCICIIFSASDSYLEIGSTLLTLFFYLFMLILETFIKNILFNILFLPLLGIFIILRISNIEQKWLKLVALNFSFFTFVGSLLLLLLFNNFDSQLQFVTKISWISSFNISFAVGIDGMSLFFLLLSTFLVPLCLLSSWDNKKNVKEFLVSFLLLEFFLIGTFCVLDLILFYAFFESVLIPMFFIIGIWGSWERKILAAYYFFFYTLLGSSLMLLAICYIQFTFNTGRFEFLLVANFSYTEQRFLWAAFFIAFASKVPMIPFHLWLPEAHVEAPTAGSVILAGVLLKLGTYGFVRFSIVLFPDASTFFTPMVYSLAVIGILYSSLTAIRQTDFKRIIAYTSIAHMNIVVIGIFSLTSTGVGGAIIQSLSHGFVSSALFLIIGVVYDRHKTRLIQYYGGLTSVMPLYAIVALFFTLANIGFPLTSSFVGEFLILVWSFNLNTAVTILSALSLIISGAYSLWLYNWVYYGVIKVQYISFFWDLSPRELIVLTPLILCTLTVGIGPNILLNSVTVCGLITSIFV